MRTTLNQKSGMDTRTKRVIIERLINRKKYNENVFKSLTYGPRTNGCERKNLANSAPLLLSASKNALIYMIQLLYFIGYHSLARKEHVKNHYPKY